MKKLLYFLMKNNTFPVFVMTVLAFAFWSLLVMFFHQPEVSPLRFINPLYALLIFLLCLLYKKLDRVLSVSIYAVCIISYSVLLPFVVQMVCGTELYLLCAIPSIFLLTAEYKRPRCFYSVMNLLLFLALAVTVGFRVTHTPPAKLFIAERRLFFMLSHGSAVLVSVVLMIYCGFNTLVMLRHLEYKSRFLQNELDYTAKHDVLTSLMNRHRTAEVFNAYELRKKVENVDFALCIFDIDNFKRINDTYGHDAGDYILKNYSSAIRYSFSEPVKVARWGGEEFLIMYPSITPDTIYELDRVRKRLASEPLVYNGQEIPVTATFGISSSRHFSTASEVLADADRMLLEGKNNGKNRVVVSEKF